ncbi:MAG: hypothetical protein FWG93_06825 [Oscillospiraceae bacterium]|nr:hypothetical protein [Oscillospiraceae bacterium]
MSKPDRGNYWLAFVTEDNGANWLMGQTNVYPNIPWEPGIMPPGDDDILIIPAATAAGSVAPPLPPSAPWVLDLTNELLKPDEEAPPFNIAGYSLNGGARWKKGAPTPRAVKSLFSRGGTLVLTDRMNARGKAPFAGSGDEPAAVLLTFSRINPAPKAPFRLLISYNLLADATGATTGAWTLVDRGDHSAEAAVVRDNLRIAWAKDGKNATVVGKEYVKNADKSDWIFDDTTGHTFGRFPVTGDSNRSDGLAVAVEQGKIKTQTYRLKLAAKEEADGSFTPASRERKIQVLNQRKPPKVKVNYRKEIIELRNGMTMVFGADVADLENRAESTPGGYLAEEGKSLVGLSREEAQTPILLESYLDETETTVTFWRSATATRPASVKQTLTLAPRAILTETLLKTDRVRIRGRRDIVVYDSERGKYGVSPWFQSAYTAPARLKNTARADKKNGYVGFAASKPGTLNITWGVRDPESKKPQNGILSATVAAPLEYEPYLVRIEDKDATVEETESNEFVLSVKAGELAGFDAANFTVDSSLGDAEVSGAAHDPVIAVSIPKEELKGRNTVAVTVTATPKNGRAKVYAPAGKLTATLNIVVNEPAGDDSGAECDCSDGLCDGPCDGSCEGLCDEICACGA